MKILLKMVKGISFMTIVFGISLAMSPSLKSAVFPPVDDTHRIAEAYEARQSNLLIEADATVVWVYPEVDDDRRYQEFSIVLDNGLRLRVQHSLDEAQRVPLKKNSAIRIRGEYDWTRDGGLIHWTHDDPDGQREGGWIELNGEKFL